MHLAEVFLTEMSLPEYQAVSARLESKFRAAKINLILTSHIRDQVATNQERAESVSPEIFIEMMDGILSAYQKGLLDKHLRKTQKLPEAHVLFKHKQMTGPQAGAISNAPAAFGRSISDAYKYKLTIITFKVQNVYLNDNFPRDAVQWV